MKQNRDAEEEGKKKRANSFKEVQRAPQSGRSCLLDFQKSICKGKVAFVQLAHSIQGDAARWIQNWLAGRSQRVSINQSYSNWAPVTSCVPQGSTLVLPLSISHIYIYIYIGIGRVKLFI